MVGSIPNLHLPESVLIARGSIELHPSLGEIADGGTLSPLRPCVKSFATLKRKWHVAIKSIRLERGFRPERKDRPFTRQDLCDIRGANGNQQNSTHGHRSKARTLQ